MIARGDRPHQIARHRAEAPLPVARDAHGAAVPDLQRRAAIACSRACRRSTSPSAQTGAAGQFDIFILSDTTDPGHLHRRGSRLPGAARSGSARCTHLSIATARRTTPRRPATSPNGCGASAAPTSSMIVLDADSLMTGDTLVRLVAAMERNPSVGLIQTFPVMVNATTPFARVQQFAGRALRAADRLRARLVARRRQQLLGPQRRHPHARLRGVRRACRCLSGPRPIGGHILSHDFVEAALMRRGGWAVHMAPALGGSYEECPPSLTEYAARDRRWCQGNLQHAGVLPARGLHWVSRLHLLTGIGSYVAAPLWLVVPAHRHPDLAAGAVHPARIFPEDLHALSAMARAGSGARRLCVRRHDGRCCSRRSCSAIWRCCADRPTRRGFGGAAPRVRQHARRDRHLGPDRAGDDADPVDLGHPDPDAAATAAGRRSGATTAACRCATSCAATAGTRRSDCCWRSPPTRCRFRCSPG